MEFYKKIKKYIKNLSLTDEKAWNPSLWSLAGSQSLSGENVTEATALTYSAVWNAVALIAGTVSTLPLHLLRKDQKKTIFVKEKRLSRIMHDQFNPYMTAQVGREVMMSHVLTWGNGYAEIVRDNYGEIKELWPIQPDRVTIEMVDGRLMYRVRMNIEQDIILPREKVLHIAGLGFDGFQGYSVVAMARKSFGLGMALETFGSLYFGQGTHPGIIVEHPGKLSAQSHANLKQSLTEVHSGLGKSHKLMLLEDGMTMKPIGIPPEDSQFLQSRQFQIPEVARWFNLPPHKLKDLTRASFNNIESEQISFVTDSILPWLVRLEQAYNLQLLNESERYQQNIYTRHNVDGLLRGNAKDRAEYYRIMFNIGTLSINEIRDKEEKDPLDNEFANEHFVPLNMVPISMLREMLEKNNVPQDQKTPAKENIIVNNISTEIFDAYLTSKKGKDAVLNVLSKKGRET